MRQIGDDLRSDPRVAIVTSVVDSVDLNDPSNAQAFGQYTWNKFAEMSHKYCGNGVDLSSATSSEVEQARFKTCLSKYSQVFSLFREEQGIHFTALAAIDKVGGDRFAKFNEYDKY